MRNLSTYHCETGAGEAARRYAHEAVSLAREHGFQPEEAWGWLCLGDAEMLSGQVQAAYQHYQTALKIRRSLKDVTGTCDALASLAGACLELGDLDQARQLVDELLSTWRSQNLLGSDQPIKNILVCYRVLASAWDPRASQILADGYRLLQECAGNIDNPVQHAVFLREVPQNRALAELWEREQGKRNRDFD